MEVQNLKKAVSQMYEVCDQMEEKTNFHEKTGLTSDIRIADILKVDMLHFLAYLAASDGVISWDESHFIGDVLAIHMTPPILNQIIQDNNVYSTDFEEDPPIALRIFVALDNALYESGIDNKTELGSALFELYRLLVVGLVEANGRTGDTMMASEREDAQTYLGMMKTFIDDNSKKQHVDIILDYGKRQGKKKNENTGVRAPLKKQKASGTVKAPKKRM